MCEEIPIVDLSVINENPTPETWRKIAVEFDEALKCGFMYLTNHSVSKETIQHAFLKSRNFFKMPIKEKEKYQMDPKREIFGYLKPNQQQLDHGNSSDRRESFDFVWKHRMRLKSTDLLPVGDREISNFYSALWDISQECLPLVSKLLRLVAMALNLDENRMLNHVKCLSNPCVPNYTAFRTIFYNQQENSGENAVRLPPHTDYGIHTLLFQDDVGGLEMKSSAGEWVPVRPLPGAILLNTGNVLECWSGGRYRAKLHRVKISSSESNTLERQSMAFFVLPDDDAQMQSMTGAEDKKGPWKAHQYNAGEYIKSLVESSFKY